MAVKKATSILALGYSLQAKLISTVHVVKFQNSTQYRLCFVIHCGLTFNSLFECYSSVTIGLYFLLVLLSSRFERYIVKYLTSRVGYFMV